MTFALDPDVAAVLAAAGDIPPMPPAGDVADHEVTTADGAQLLAR